MLATELEPLRSLIRKIIENSGNVDPASIAAEVTEATPARHLRHYYTEALTTIVRIELASERREAIRASAASSTLHESPSPTTSKRRPNKSAKRLAAGNVPEERWARFLNTSVSVGSGQWKRLGSCTTDDIAHVVDGYHSRVEQNARWANYYSELQSEMARLHAETVDDLPTSVIEKIGVPA